jgi:hypothetical protein
MTHTNNEVTWTHENMQQRRDTTLMNLENICSETKHTEERETGEKRDETGEGTEGKLDWEDEVEREYQKMAPTPPTTPCDLSCLWTSAARPWRNLRRHARFPPNPQHTTAPHPTHSPPYSWTSY